MVEFKQILHPTDLSDASMNALRHAAALARWYDARLTVLHVVPSLDPIEVPPTRIAGAEQILFPPSRDLLLGQMQEALGTEYLNGVDAQMSVEAGDTAAVIVDQALSTTAELVVMGTHGRGGFDRLIFGSVTEKVLRQSPCPVLAVPPHTPEAAATDVTFERILCPVDFSPASLQALGFALDLARQANGLVSVLHVIEWLAEEEPRISAHYNASEFRQHLIDDARTKLDELLVSESRTWCEVEGLVAAGRAHRQVLHFAEEKKADLIVIGAQGRGGTDLTLFGSTTHQVLRNAACPVLVVRAAGA